MTSIPPQPQQMAEVQRHFDTACGIASESEEHQISTLLYCLGEEAEDVLKSTNISDEERKSYKQVLGKMDAFFKVLKNVTFEHARFNWQTQRYGETVEGFITCLYNQAADCQYGNLRDEMICDHLVVGILDTSLSERLQVDADLTLEEAKQIVRQREAIHKQQSLLNHGEQPAEMTLSYGNTVKRSRNQPKTMCSHGRGHSNQKCTRCEKAHTRVVPALRKKPFATSARKEATTATSASAKM